MANMTNHRCWHTIAINFTIVKPIVRTSPQPLKADLKSTHTHAHTHVPALVLSAKWRERSTRPVLEERSVVRADVIGPLVSVATPRARSVLGCRSRGEPILEDTFPLWIQIDPSLDHVRNTEQEEEEESSCDRR